MAGTESQMRSRLHHRRCSERPRSLRFLARRLALIAMKRALLAILSLSGVASSAVLAQPMDPAVSLKEGFGPPKVPPIDRISGRTMMGLEIYSHQAHSRKLVRGESDVIRGMLAETYIGGVSLSD